LISSVASAPLTQIRQSVYWNHLFSEVSTLEMGGLAIATYALSEFVWGVGREIVSCLDSFGRWFGACRLRRR